MRIYCEKDYNAMSRRAANIIAALVLSKPDCVLGLATGSSPVGTYQNLWRGTSRATSASKRCAR